MIVHLAAVFALQTPAAHPVDRWFGSDKLKHFLVAGFTQSVAYSALQAARADHAPALAGAWTATAVVSIAKEIHDRRSYGLFSVKDLAWDAAGAGAATLLIRRTVRSGADESPRPAATSSFAPVTAALLFGAARRPIFSVRAQPTPAPHR